MNISKKIKDMFNEKFTFVIIPHSGKKTKQLKFYKPIIYFTVTFFTVTSIFFISSTIYLFNNNTSLTTHLQEKNDQIHSLNLVVERQHTEIEDLKSTSQFVINKLSQLYDLESKIRNMVGLKANENVKKNPTTSRSLNAITDVFNDLNAKGGPYDLNSLTDTNSVAAITGLINSQKENYDNLIKDVEKQLKYLECKPDIWPATGKISSPFGYRIHPLSRRRHFHTGIDIANKSGTIIVSAGSGIVTFSGWNGGYGKVIIIAHGYGYKSVYAHNSSNLVKVGDRVKKGQIIGKIGSTGISTGSHVHFEILFNGQHIDPLKVLKNK